MVRGHGGDEDLTALEPTAAGDDGPLRLLVVAEGLTRHQELPAVGALVIGRSREAGLRIDLPSISRRHAVLHVERTSGTTQLRLEDAGSANGTRVRGARLDPGAIVPIRPGDLIELGSTVLVVQRGPAAADAAPADSPPRAPVVETALLTSLGPTLERVARGSIHVLLLGETGVGKEVVAQRIHELSARARYPMLRLNAAALSEELLSSELFGHERGAFTGAVARKKGLLETADGGTVFLDEVGDLPPAVQAKLLRVLEDGLLWPVGGLAPRTVDLRFVTATNHELEREVEQGTFRSDLYFRLSAVVLRLPPLRERPDEIEPLARAFATHALAMAGWPGEPRFGPGVIELLRRRKWPGNVRELKNAIERAVVLGGGRTIQTGAFDELAASPAPPSPDASAGGGEPDLRAGVSAAERRLIVEALERCQGNQTRAARMLGISRRTLVKRLDVHGLPRPRKR